MKGFWLAVIVGTAPSVFLLSFFYLKDRYEREPLHHIVMAFGLGTYAMIAARGMAAVYHWDEFDEPLDGVVYGVAVSLGFATLENILYIVGRGIGVAWGRALFAVPAHALFGGTMGYYAGRAKFDRAAARIGALRRDYVLCLLLPVAFHGTYNYALHHRLDARVWAAVTIISLALWIFVLRRVHRAQRASPFRTD